jgi:MoaA/NifB/PqqE/SkfB family radical SAM enzyme
VHFSINQNLTPEKDMSLKTFHNTIDESLGSLNYKSPTYYELKAPSLLDWRPYRPESYFLYRKEWDRRGKEGDPGDFPLHLDIDPTNRCNLRCVMCPRTKFIEANNYSWAPDGLKDIDYSLYQKLIDEGINYGLMSVKLNFLGEPLLYPKLTNMVSYAKDKGLWVMLNTNAVLLDYKTSLSLLDAGLTDIFFSFDSPYKEEYEKIRVGASFEKTLQNIKGFMELKDTLGKKYVQTRASMILPEDPKGREDIKRDYIKLMRDLKIAEIGFGLPTVIGRDYASINPNSFFRCPDLFRRVFIFNDGVAGPCCGDWERRLIVGDATKSTLKEIWNSKSYKDLRKPHLEGDYRKIEACLACSVPYLATMEDI